MNSVPVAMFKVQTMSHIVDCCSLTILEGCLLRLHITNDNARLADVIWHMKHSPTATAVWHTSVLSYKMFGYLCCTLYNN